MTPEKRIQELLDLVLDGSCTDDQRSEFSSLLDENPDLVPAVAREVFLHNLLVWNSDGTGRTIPEELIPEELDSDTFAGCELVSEIACARPGKPLQSGQRLTAQKLRNLRWVWALAASLLVMGWFLVDNVLQLQALNHHLAVAKLIESNNVVWAETPSALSGENLVPGRLETMSGDLTLQFRSGPTVRLQGPASVLIESDMLVHLDRGQATAKIPWNVNGFRIKTPVVDVIDQGTEFGVASRSDGLTDVVVFNGEVDLQDHLSPDAAVKRLGQGEAARVDRRGDVQRIMQVGINDQGAWWTDGDTDPRVNVIKEVRDNIPPSDGSKYFCYQISTNGFQEDCLAFADSSHQFNGLSREGMPKILLGADYVKTFNDYRYLNYFKMEVMLARPADLYVVFDDRVPPPRWLTEQFQDTGLDIGLDEGPWSKWEQARRPDLPVFSTGKGPGVSIDNVFSIWHRACHDTSPVVLGAMGPTSEARAMYAVAATPLTSGRIAATDSVPRLRESPRTNLYALARQAAETAVQNELQRDAESRFDSEFRHNFEFAF